MNAAPLIALLSLTACSSGPSHILPLHRIPSADADNGGGVVFDMSSEVFRLSEPRCAKLARQVSQDTHIYKIGTTYEQVEKLTVAFMVYGK